jgi:hypothetical protein
MALGLYCDPPEMKNNLEKKKVIKTTLKKGHGHCLL